MRQIVYFSTAVGRQDAITVAAVMAVSRERNMRESVSGLLIAGGNRYLQVIEGPTRVVDATMARIRRDHRHLGVTVLVKRRTEKRSFSGWSTAYCDPIAKGEFATLGELVDQARTQFNGGELREEIDCLARSFVIAPHAAAPHATLSPWTMASGYEARLSLDRGH